MTKKKDSDRGYNAHKPSEIPAKGWKDIGGRVLNQVKSDHVQIISAGVAFYFFMALFPTIIAAMSIYGLILNPGNLQGHISTLSRILPVEASGMIEGFIKPIISKPSGHLSWSLILSIFVSLWSANQGTKALFEGINIAYNENDTRSFFRKTGLTLLFTIGGLVIGFLSILIVIFFPAFVENIHLGTLVESVIGWSRWLIMGGVIIFALGIIYKVAPNRDNPELRWISWGSIIATTFWILGSLLFSWYVKNFGSYGEMYGSLAAVVIMLLWLFLTAFIILLGAEINSEMEHQTRKDTTVGPDKPLGKRGGYYADHVASKSEEQER